jgi:hypothetical protein
LRDPPNRVVRRSTPTAGGGRVVISQPARSVARSSGQGDWNPVTKRSQVERLVTGEADTKERQ